MIKIQRINAPSELTDEVVKVKTDLFITNNKKCVWKEDYIKNRLMEMTHGKCCYCECKLAEESKYMEVEHFHDKHHFPNEVVKWENLLPSCKSCNGHKSNHNTVINPIIKPDEDNPKDHLGQRSFRYKGLTSIGEETINLLNLNNIERRCLPRFLVCSALIEKMEDCLVSMQGITQSTDSKYKNRIRNKVLELLEACQNDREYTAFKATTMLANSDYLELVKEMNSKGLWNTQLDNLDKAMSWTEKS